MSGSDIDLPVPAMDAAMLIVRGSAVSAIGSRTVIAPVP
jgi:hypothetical protein